MATRILVPLDGSPLAEEALGCAHALARGLPAELILFRAVWIPPDVRELLNESTVELNAILAQAKSEADEYLRGLKEQLGKLGPDVHSVVRDGPAAEAILEYAMGEKVDQIVMATHGYSGFKRWTHGSVAERVLQATEVPLLLVRADERGVAQGWQQPAHCRRILAPLDGSPTAEQILPTLTPVVRAMGANLTLFQVPIAYSSGAMTGELYLPLQGVLETAEGESRAYLGAVAARLAAQGLDVPTATANGSVANCIIEYAEANRVDLIAMCTHGRTGLARWALGSVADRILRAGSTPILLVRAQ